MIFYYSMVLRPIFSCYFCNHENALANVAYYKMTIRFFFYFTRRHRKKLFEIFMAMSCSHSVNTGTFWTGQHKWENTIIMGRGRCHKKSGGSLGGSCQKSLLRHYQEGGLPQQQQGWDQRGGKSTPKPSHHLRLRELMKTASSPRKNVLQRQPTKYTHPWRKAFFLQIYF